MYYTIYDLENKKIGIAVNTSPFHGLFSVSRFPLSAIIILSVLAFMIFTVSVAFYVDYKLKERSKEKFDAERKMSMEKVIMLDE